VSKKAVPPVFNSDVYTKITLNDLLVYSIYYLHRQGSGITSEDVISACFLLFPKRFSMRKYPQWPDAGIVRRRWSDSKSKGYLRGNAASGFQITPRGIKRAEKIEKSLGRAIKPTPAARPRTKTSVLPVETVHPELRARARKYVRSIEASDAYRHFIKRKPINEFDFRSLLLCTMESPPAVLARNMEQFKVYVQIHERTDLLTFLEFCEAKFPHLLAATTKPADKKVTKSKK
jgi:hypothetical protein